MGKSAEIRHVCKAEILYRKAVFEPADKINKNANIIL